MKSYLYDGQTGELLHEEDVEAATPPLDIVTVVAELAAQRARLDATEQAVEFLIVSSLEG